MEFEAWQQRRLDDREVVYAWADGIYVKAGLEKEKAALLERTGCLSFVRSESYPMPVHDTPPSLDEDHGSR